MKKRLMRLNEIMYCTIKFTFQCNNISKTQEQKSINKNIVYFFLPSLSLCICIHYIHVCIPSITHSLPSVPQLCVQTVCWRSWCIWVHYNRDIILCMWPHMHIFYTWTYIHNMTYNMHTNEQSYSTF